MPNAHGQPRGGAIQSLPDHGLLWCPTSVAPMGLCGCSRSVLRPCARGYCLSPLMGLIPVPRRFPTSRDSIPSAARCTRTENVPAC